MKKHSFRLGSIGFGSLGAFTALAGLSLLASQPARSDDPDRGPSNPPLVLEPHEKLLTLLGTNDIHGGVDASVTREGAPLGGLAHFAGVARSIRQGVEKRFGSDRAGVLLLDAGDQFQGTLVSNFNEGRLVFAAMSEAGYDAVIPGNHDYDFGPIGWLEDQVTPAGADQDPRGALLRAASKASFPLLSANTYVKASLRNGAGRPVQVDSSYCRMAGPERAVGEPGEAKEIEASTASTPAAGGQRRISRPGSGAIDWTVAVRPAFLKPYLVKEVAGLKVAVVGIDNPSTPTTTTLANVSDLCFDDEVAAYLRVRKELEGKADVFVAVMHDGNTDKSFDVSKFVEKLPEGSIDAVISGHTHWSTNTRVRGVPIVQSGSGGLKFGRIDLVFDTRSGKVEPAKTRSFGAVELLHERCAPAASSFCASVQGEDGSKRVAYEGVPVAPNARIQALIDAARAEVAPLATRKLGTAEGVIRVDRIMESPLANALTDAMRAVGGTDIAFMNTGGIRAPLEAGEVTYEDLYKVIPFNNHGLVVGPMAAENVLSLLQRSIQSCGAFGSLMQSGLKVVYERDCKSRAVEQVDSKARLLRVETVAGEVLFDAEKGIVPPAGSQFTVATLDFLATGGAGYEGFQGAPLIRDFGIVREALADAFAKSPVILSPRVDGRWREVRPAAPAVEPPAPMEPAPAPAAQP